MNQPQGLGQADKKNLLDKISDLERYINNTVLKRIDLVEQNLEGFQTEAGSTDNKVRMTMDRTTKVEDALKEHIDIIQTINKKVNSNHEDIDDVKQVIQNKITRLEDTIMGKQNEGADAKIEIKNLEENLRRTNEEIDLLKIDQNNFRDHNNTSIRDLEDQVKQNSNQQFLKIKELENLLMISKTENTQMNEKMSHEIMGLERDLDDVRRLTRDMKSPE